jgi:hypothetical protein
MHDSGGWKNKNILAEGGGLVNIFFIIYSVFYKVLQHLTAFDNKWRVALRLCSGFTCCGCMVV